MVSVEPCLPGVMSLETPGNLLEAEVDAEGNVYFLSPGLPHLVVVHSDCSRSRYDLDEVRIPGGMWIDGPWGWYVSCELSGTVFRYDAEGEPVSSWEAPGIPGDVAVSGFSVFYVSKTDGSVRLLSDPEVSVTGAYSLEDGRLSPIVDGLVYSGSNGAVTVGMFDSPRPLPGSGWWVSDGLEPLLVTDSSVCRRNGDELFRWSPSHSFSKVSVSPGGRYCLLWSPGADGAILISR